MTNQKPLSKNDLFAMLDAEQIDYKVLHHKPIMTVEDAKAIRTNEESDEGQVKNLFVRNKKRKMWLLTLHEDRKLDLKQTAMTLNTKRLSFCGHDTLMSYLGVLPGAVSPFCLLNDNNSEVEFYIDETLMSHPILHLHPFDNSMTVSIAREVLLEFLNRLGHPYKILFR